MNFAQPWFLFGLFALAVPIIVHLFNFRKPKTVYFTKVQLLKESVIEVNKTQKLKHYLVLASRMLFLLFLIFAFAQPVFKNNKSAEGNILGIYIDNSQSMLAGSKSGDVLTSAIDMASALSNNLSNDTKYVFIDNDFESKDINIINREQLKDRLTEINVSAKTRSVAQVQKKLKSNLERLGYSHGSNLFLLSDFQKSVNKDLDLLLNEKTTLVNLSTAGKLNIFVDTVFLENPFVMPDENTILKVSVSCSGDEGIENLPVKLMVDDIVSGTANINIAANQNTSIEFNVRIKANKASLCKIVIDDNPVVFDNEYFFVLQAIDPLKVTIISNNQNNAYTSVFGNDASFKLDNYSFNAINYGKLKETQFLVIDGIENADNVLIGYATELLKRKGTVIFNPGKGFNKTQLQDNILQLTGQSIATVKDTLGLGLETVQMPETNNPFFKNIYKSNKDNVQLPKAKIITNANQSTIYKSNLGKQVVSKWKTNQGALYSVNTVLDNQFTDFHSHPFFVTFVIKAALLSNNAEDALAYSTNTKSLKIKDKTNPNDNIKIRATGTEIIPSLYTQNNETILDLSNTSLKSGFYTIEQNNKPIKQIAINHLKAESQLESWDKANLQKQVANKKAISVLAGGDINDTVKEIKGNYNSNYLWKYCLILALIFLAAEILLIRFLKN